MVAVEPVDFRCGIDGLAQVRREVLAADPFSGAVFVFRNRRGTAIKIWPKTARDFGYATSDHLKADSVTGRVGRAAT